MKKRVYVGYFIFAIIWMGFIFYLSHQPAVISADLSTGITERIFRFLVGIFNIHEESFQALHHYVRKNAHFVAYFLLGVFTIFAMDKNKFKYGGSLAFLVGVVYAVGDEYHQLFVDGRSGQISDVVLDSIGVFCGIVIYKIVKKVNVKVYKNK